MEGMFETLNALFFFVSLLGMWCITFLYSPLHKYLRNYKVFRSFLILSILMMIISICLIKGDWDSQRKLNSFSSIVIIIYLFLYKLVDFISIKKYNRHIYFNSKFSGYFKDEEWKESTWLEFFMQISILLIPIFTWFGIGQLVE